VLNNAVAVKAIAMSELFAKAISTGANQVNLSQPKKLLHDVFCE